MPLILSSFSDKKELFYLKSSEKNYRFVFEKK